MFRFFYVKLLLLIFTILATKKTVGLHFFLEKLPVCLGTGMFGIVLVLRIWIRPNPKLFVSSGSVTKILIRPRTVQAIVITS